jgi:hypothetical protein
MKKDLCNPIPHVNHHMGLLHLLGWQLIAGCDVANTTTMERRYE